MTVRRAVIDSPESPQLEEPIQYRLVQCEGYVQLEARVGTQSQKVLRLYPHEIVRVGWVSNAIGLKMDGTTVSVT